MRNKLNQTDLDLLVKKIIDKKNITGAVFHVSSIDNSIDLISASGDFQNNSSYYIASINKLFVSSIILKLHYSSKLNLHDKISKYLPADLISGLHRYKGHDYSSDLTILNLISLNSGLPCYLADKQPDGKIAMKELEAGKDQSWPFEKVINVVKTMNSHFPPGQNRKAKYSDTNHQILSRIIEIITGEPINHVLSNLFKDLNMTNTFVLDGKSDIEYVPIKCKSKVIEIPLFLSSTQNDIISNAKDQMTFIKAFFSGYFFPTNELDKLKKWNNIFFPFKYGIGIQKFYLPRIFSPFKAIPEIIGHCGSVGAIAFYIPEKDLFITGTINQQAMPQVAFKTIVQIVSKIK